MEISSASESERLRVYSIQFCIDAISVYRESRLKARVLHMITERGHILELHGGGWPLPEDSDSYESFYWCNLFTIDMSDYE